MDLEPQGKAWSGPAVFAVREITRPLLLLLQTTAFVHGHREASWHSEDTATALELLRWGAVDYASINRKGFHWEWAPRTDASRLATACSTCPWAVHALEHRLCGV